MKPIVAKSWEADFIATPPPYERHRQVLFSPKIQGVKAGIGIVTIPPGGKSDTHSHDKSDEVWIVTKGHGKVSVDGNEVDIEPGVAVCAQAGSQHQIINTGKETLHAYFVFSPAGPEEALLKLMGKL
ncbi:MAG TPA: cupin domain-containing protein [Candidatus Bathyarchaeia archaeon]|nr:cupin domain-containing protein [Candidatus Bathyarchaeia archaeon]